jgi:hypothetical protein
MKSLAVLSIVILSSALSAQDAIPAGTILPVQLNSSLKSNRARPGQIITARLMQDLSLPAGARIHAGARVSGHVLAVVPARNGKSAKISFRFDTLTARKRHIPVITNVRALASMMDVSQAHIPESGPDHGTSEYNWTTDQIGGEIDYHGGGAIVHDSEIIGYSVANGVLARATAKPGSECRAAVAGNDLPQALWVFSSDACGLYDFPDVTLVHAGRTSPVGQIVLESNAGDLNIRAGSGMLLRVN